MFCVGRVGVLRDDYWVLLPGGADGSLYFMAQFLSVNCLLYLSTEMPSAISLEFKTKTKKSNALEVFHTGLFSYR